MSADIVRISIITDAVTTDWSVGQKVLSAFTDIDERLIPQKLFQWESPVGLFTSVDDCKAIWAQVAQMRAGGSFYEFPVGLNWKRKSATKYQAEIKHSQMDLQGKRRSGGISVYAQPNLKIDWLAVFRQLCEAMRPKFGQLHLFTDRESKNIASGTPESYFLSGILVGSAIPNIAWATLFGSDFADDVDAERVSSAGFLVEPLAGGHLVQATDNFTDVAKHYPNFSARRTELKALFPDDLFLIKTEPRDV